jgi:large repetitive protein
MPGRRMQRGGASLRAGSRFGVVLVGCVISTVVVTGAQGDATHPDITAEATGPNGAMVTYPDSDAPPKGIICSPTSGSLFALGTRGVKCSNYSFAVTVVDTTPPLISVPTDMTVEATGPSGAVVSFAASATDLVDGSVAPVCSPASGSTFPIAATQVTCSATDAHKNSSSAGFMVTVGDTTPPTVKVPGAISDSATSSAGKAETFTATATDLVDG